MTMGAAAFLIFFVINPCVGSRQPPPEASRWVSFPATHFQINSQLKIMGLNCLLVLRFPANQTHP